MREQPESVADRLYLVRQLTRGESNLVVRLTDQVHLILVSMGGPLSRTDYGQKYWRKAQTTKTNPRDRSAYLLQVATCWSLVMAVLMAASGISALDIEKVGHGDLAHRVAIVGVLFAAGVCLTGVADVWWRMILVKIATYRWNRSSHTLDARSQRLMRLARVNRGVLVIQLAVGVAAAWLLS